jgi:hypothetical protein
VFALVTVALLAFGWFYPTEHYITPQSGAGYALGIAGGSAMLLLLVYPARKRVPALAFLGSTRRWFQIHMVLGIAGPLLVLFHSNFTLGATNSNVALFSMLIVAGSGLFGRYFYAQIHHGLYGRRATLAELKAYAARLQADASAIDFLPQLVERLDSEERRIVQQSERTWILARPLVSAIVAWRARHRLHRFVRIAARACGAHTGGRASVIAAAKGQVDERVRAVRRVCAFGAYERLFSVWHAFHLPLFLMLLVAGIVHVIAVNVY